MTTDAAPKLKPRGRAQKGVLRKSATTEAARRSSKDVWDPKWIGVIRNYPRSAEAFEERKARGRAVFQRRIMQRRAVQPRGSDFESAEI